MHRGQHVRAVGALLAAGLDEAARLEALQHGVQEQVLGPARDETGAELAEHAEVETGVGQLEPERVFPVDAGAHGIGGLPITEVLQKLEDRYKSQSPRGQAGLAPGGEEAVEILVLVEGAELVTQPRGQGASGECRAGDAHRLSRNLTDRLRAQTHGSLPCWMAT